MDRRRVGKKGGVLRMGKYEFTKEQRECLERMKQPFAVFQYLNKKVVALVLSDGFFFFF